MTEFSNDNKPLTEQTKRRLLLAGIHRFQRNTHTLSPPDDIDEDVAGRQGMAWTIIMVVFFAAGIVGLVLI